MAISAEHNKFVYPDYISALPADIYIQGAVKRQDMYDEGRLKIQNQIDTFSQIQNQLVKPVDKQYFEKEMGNLLKEINKNAGLDFSVKGNFNAVMNIGKPLENNSYIRGAIKSSSNYNKMMEEYQSLPSDQRGSANDYFFMKNINSWMSDETPGSQLNYSSYVPYDSNINKAYGEVISKLKPVTEKKLTFSKDGKWMIKEVISSVDQQRVMAAYMGAIGESGMRQLQMDAQYKLETTGKDIVGQQYLAEQKLNYDGLEEYINQASSQYQELVLNKKENSPEAIQLKTELDKRAKQRDILAKKLSTNPNDFSNGELLNFIINDSVMDTAGAYAYSSVEQDINANPYALSEFNKGLELANYIQKQQIDMEADMMRQSLGLGSSSGKLAPPPPGSQATTAELRKNSEQFYSSADLFGGFADAGQYKEFINAFERHVVGSEFAYDKDGKIIRNTKIPGKNTVGDAIARFSDFENWDDKDREVMAKAFGSASKAEQFYNKMKVLGNTLGVSSEAKSYNKNIQGINLDLTGKEEEEVEKILTDNFSKYGFKFEQTGIGDNIIVTAPNGETQTFELDNWTKSGDREEAKRLQEFIGNNSPIKATFRSEQFIYDNELKRDKIYPTTAIDLDNTNLLVDYNIPGFEPHTKIMRVEDFLNLSAAELYSITGVSADKQGLVRVDN
jgi:hypothetical protein